MTQPALTSSFCSSWHSRNTGGYSARSSRLLWSGRVFYSCIRQCREGCCYFCCNRCSSIRPMKRVSRMLARIEQGSGRTELTKGTMLPVDARRAITLLTQVFYSSERQPFFEQPFREGKIPLCAGKRVRVQLCSLEDYKFFFKKEPALVKNAVDCDKMKDNAVFRQRKEGDRIALAHQSGSRPLKKLWNEAKTPQQQRWRSAVLSDSDGVVWVERAWRRPQGAAGRRQQNGCVDMGRGGNQMKEMQDDILKVLLSQQEIADKVCEIGKQITKDYEGEKSADGQRAQRLGRIYGGP